MDFRPPFPNRLPDPGSAGFAEAVESYLLRLRSFYNSRAIWHRRFYRLSGILVILVGATLPLAASLDYAGKELLVSLLGVAVVVITALRAFYRWDQSWILLRGTEMAITTAWWDYCAALDEAAEGADEQARLAGRRDAARTLIRALNEIRRRESESFFRDISFPGEGAAG
jgi:hypothetical protein